MARLSANHLFCKLIALIWAAPLFAQSFSIDGPNSATSIKSCDDFASQVLGDPWDMNNTIDLPNYTIFDIGSLSNTVWANGLFSFTTAAANQAYFHLFSPEVEGAYRISGINNSRWGQDLNLNTAKYSHLAMRMSSSKYLNGGIKLIWNRSRGYVANSTVTAITPNRLGWYVYRIDLDTIGLSTSESSNTSVWSAAPVTGFAIQPNQENGSNMQLDWVRLEDPDSCASYNVPYTASAGAGLSRVSLYVDDDLNPFNGYIKQIASGAAASGSATASLSSLGIFPGSYNVSGFIDGDYATLVRTNPWDMSDENDVSSSFGLSASISGGMYSGVSTSIEPTVILPIDSGGINASTYKFMRFKLTTSNNATPVLFWHNGSTLVSLIVTRATYDANGDNIFEINLSGLSGWSGTISEILLRPATTNGVTFQLDYVTLGTTTFINPRDVSANVSSASNQIDINIAPIGTILKPDPRGGAQLRAWNMNPEDIKVFGNLRDDPDPAYPGEPYSAYLPDVRYVYGERGDYFKGTNRSGNADPSNHSTFNSLPFAFSALDYPNLCFKLAVDPVSASCHIPVARVIWEQSHTSDDLLMIHDRWGSSRWYEYCTDMRSMRQEGTNSMDWSGTINSLRVDPHEYSHDICDNGGNGIGNEVSTPYYFDFIKLRSDYSSNTGSVPIVYKLEDADDSNASISFYYTTTKGALGTLITTQAGSTAQKLYEWDTSALPSNTYYLNSVVDDGTNSTTTYGSKALRIAGLGASKVAPQLNLQVPSEAQTVCNTLQIKGYAVQTDRVENTAAIQTWLDSTLLGTVQADQYGNEARAAFPSADSSNAAFNVTYDISAASTGVHNVTVRAWSSDGGFVDIVRAVDKSNSNCPNLVSDADPAGAPISVPVDDPNSSLEKPSINRIKYSKNQLTFNVRNSGDSACTISISAGSRAADLGVVKTATPSSSSSGLRFRAKALKISPKIKKFILRAKRSCAGNSDSTSKAFKVAVHNRKGSVKTIPALKTALSKKLQTY